MALRRQRGMYHNEPGWSKIWCKFTTSNGTPTLVAGNGVTSVTKSATGKITFVLTEPYALFMGANVSFLGTTEVGRKIQWESSTFNTKTLIMRLYDMNSPGNLKNFPDTTVYVEFNLDLSSGV